MTGCLVPACTRLGWAGAGAGDSSEPGSREMKAPLGQASPLVPLRVLHSPSPSPHQNSRFPPTATTQQSEGLVLQDSWSF